jgi:hypothetical protein
MRIGLIRLLACTPLAWAFVPLPASAADETGPSKVERPIYERFAEAGGEEVPSFQRHVSPLFGRLGCNGRSCHGSFQGRGDFRLSLFGYDFKADHEALLDAKRPRVDVKNIDESLILAKPTDADMHEGGERYKKGSWQHHVLRRWIEAGAKYDTKDVQKLVQLNVTPAEIQFSKPGQTVQMKAVAVWPDGTQEDVTPLCRFQSNSEQVAKIDENGLVTATESGDTHVVISYDSHRDSGHSPCHRTGWRGLSEGGHPHDHRQTGNRKAAKAGCGSVLPVHRCRVPPPGFARSDRHSAECSGSGTVPG